MVSLKNKKYIPIAKRVIDLEIKALQKLKKKLTIHLIKLWLQLQNVNQK